MLTVEPIRVLVVHRDAVSRAGLAATFRGRPGFDVMNPDAPAEHEPLLHEAPARWQADVVVADYELGVELALRIARYPVPAVSCKVMIVASTDREWRIRHALACGVRGYVLAGCALAELGTAVQTVHRGLRHLSPTVAQRLAESLAGECLTVREEEVLRLVIDGLSNKAIARRLDIAIGTVKAHVKGVFGKLSVESRTQAVAAAERRGLLSEVKQDPLGETGRDARQPVALPRRPNRAPSSRPADPSTAVRRELQAEVHA